MCNKARPGGEVEKGVRPKHGSRKTRTSKIKKKRPEGAVPDRGEARGVARQGP